MSEVTDAAYANTRRCAACRAAHNATKNAARRLRFLWSDAAYGNCRPGGNAGSVVGDTVAPAPGWPGEEEVTGAGACVAVEVPCGACVVCDAPDGVDGLVDEAFASRRLRSSSLT
uniref:Uncharacterized protein n=1 Tax=Ralstonia solanacearum TaxID=305 RepID=A0A0S4UXL8_RALSL|nr:protein of unknown function [Ralstonia solanacearum]CUV27060.1 protein of unknown function [Ralstonia solanacearum]